MSPLGERGDIFVKGRLLFVETESNRQKSVDLDALKVWWVWRVVSGDV